MALPRHTAVLWANPDQVDLARSMATAANLELVAAGSPQRAQSATVASALGTERADDLRLVMHETKVDLVVMLAVGDFGSGAATEDAAAVFAAHGRGVRVFTAEPVPSNVLELDSGGWTSLTPAPTTTLRTLGLPRVSRVFREAAETLTAFGDPRSVLIEHWAAPHHGSLAARLVGAIDLAHSLVGETETIDAVHVPSGVGGLSTRVAERALLEHHGDLNATLRTSDGRSALIAVSNSAARWNWCVTLLSERGRLRFYDDGFEWLAPDGQKRDEHRDPARTRGSPAPDHAAAVLGDSLCRILDDSLPDPGPLNVSSVLPVAHAAFLSARTSHPENPGTIRGMILT
jgi:hypothetical protein